MKIIGVFLITIIQAILTVLILAFPIFFLAAVCYYPMQTLIVLAVIFVVIGIINNLRYI